MSLLILFPLHLGCVISLLLSIPISAAEGNNQIDSLDAIIRSPSSSDTSIVNAYIALSDIYCVINLDTVIPICLIANEITRRNLDDKDIKPEEKKIFKIALSNSYNNIGYVHQKKGAMDSALKFYMKCLEIDREMKNEDGMASTLNNIGAVYNSQGDVARGFEYYTKSLQILESIGDKSRIARTLNNLGLIFKKQGNIEKALEYYHKSLKINEQIGYKQGMSLSFNNLGVLYKNQGDYTKAIEYYHKSMKIYTEIGYNNGVALSLNNIGIIYSEIGDPACQNSSEVCLEEGIKKGLEYLIRSLEIDEENGNKEGVARCLTNIGTIYAQKAYRNSEDTVSPFNMNKAMQYFQKSLKMSEEMNDKYWQCFALNGMCRLKLFINQLDSARVFASRSFILAQELGYPSKISDVTSLLSRIAKKEAIKPHLSLKNQVDLWKESLQMYQEFIVNRDSVLNLETQKNTIRQQTKYDFEKAIIVKEQADIEQQRIDLEAISRRHHLQNSIILIGLFVVFGMVFLLGKYKIPNYVVEIAIFIPFLLFFEFALTLLDPIIENWTGGAPVYKLLINAGLAFVIFPIHNVLEKFMLKNIFNTSNKKKVDLPNSFLIIICFCCFSILLGGNNHSTPESENNHVVHNRLDSLQQVLKIAQHDSIRINLLVQLSEECDPSEILKYALPAVELIDKNLNQSISSSQKNRFLQRKATAFNNIGFIYRIQGDISKSLDYFQTSMEIRKNILKTFPDWAELKQSIAESLINLGGLYNDQGDISNSLTYYHQSLAIYEEINDIQGMALNLNNIGGIYAYQNDYEKGLEYYHKGLKLREQIKDKQGIAGSLNNIGSIYIYKGDLEQGLSYLRRSLILEKEIGAQQGIASRLINIGTIHKRKGDAETIDSLRNDNFRKSEGYFRESLQICKKIQDDFWLCSGLQGMSNLKLGLNQLDSALLYAQQSMMIAQKLGYPVKIRFAAQLLYGIAQRKANSRDTPLKEQVILWQEALTNYELFIINRDSVLNKETQKAAIRQQTKYEFEKAMLIKEQALKNRKRMESEAITRRNNLQYSGISIGILFLGLMVAVLGYVRISPQLTTGFIFFAFLIFFEFILVITDPYVENLTGGAPGWKLLFNAFVAGIIFPLHEYLERVLKKRLLRS